MKRKIGVFVLPLFFASTIFAQNINRVDGTKISVDSLQNKIEYLMKTANVSGVCISVFNKNRPVFTRAFGLANVPKKEPLKTSTVLYGASFSKVVFAYIVMQLVQEKRIDLDKPLVGYLTKPWLIIK